MTLQLVEPPAQQIARSASEIRVWIVAEISRALNVEPLTVDTAASLDTLGVDSLAAIGMTGSLAAWLNRDLPATLMWDYPSIDGLAEGLADADEKPEAHPGIIPLQGQGDRLPLYCFPGLGGHPAIFAAMCGYLRPDHPCFGLVVPGLTADQAPLATVEDIATAMVKAIQHVQPKGPYQLAGYSFGGYLAYEVAQQLVAVGETVSMLAIYDTYTPAGRVFRPLWQRVLLHAWLSATGPAHLKHLGTRVNRIKILKPRASKPKATPTRSADPLHRRGEAVWIADKNAANIYQPRPYAGSVLLFRATGRTVDSPFWRLEKSNGWGALAAGGVEVIEIPGIHGDILNPENSSAAAEKLRPYLCSKRS